MCLGKVLENNSSNENYEKILKEITEIYAMCRDSAAKERLSRLMDFVDSLTVDKNKPSLEEEIANMLVETKDKNPELNASLYILYWDFRRKKLSEEAARDLFARIIKSDKFDRRGY
jgi:hypothetical protein